RPGRSSPMTTRQCAWKQKCRRALGVLLALGGLMVGGCDGGAGFALSLRPFYSPADLETDQALAGAWATKEGGATFTLEHMEGKGYKLVVKEREGEKETTSQFEAHLVRLGSTLFLDFLPNGASDGSEFYQMHLFRAHSIARIELSRDTLQMAFFDGLWLKKKI